MLTILAVILTGFVAVALLGHFLVTGRTIDSRQGFHYYTVVIASDQQKVYAGGGYTDNGKLQGFIRAIPVSDRGQAVTFHHHACIRQVVLASDERHLVFLDINGTVGSLDVGSGKCAVGIATSVCNIAATADGDDLVTAIDAQVILTDLIAGRSRTLWHSQNGTVTALAITDDGETVLVGTNTGTIHAVNRNGVARGSGNIGNNASVRSMSISRRGRLFAALSSDGAIRVFSHLSSIWEDRLAAPLLLL